MQPSFLGSYHTRFTMAHLQLNRTYICHSLIHVFICPCWRRVFIVALKRIIQILYEIKWDHLSGSIKSPKNYVKPIAGLNYSIRRIVRNLLDSNRCRREATRKKICTFRRQSISTAVQITWLRLRCTIWQYEAGIRWKPRSPSYTVRMKLAFSECKQFITE